jgi:hypothetical protein
MDRPQNSAANTGTSTSGGSGVREKAPRNTGRGVGRMGHAKRRLDRHTSPMNLTSIEGTGIITQPGACDLIIGQLTLPASRQFRVQGRLERARDR